ncbi:MAG: MlaD family protein [Methylacidiphilales bacterium]|nr:MlaD family protein [Candidatus Methylacidiphilales bacterium]
MQIHRNEITTGLLVLASAGILLGVLAVLAAPGLVKHIKTYKIYYDNAGGIRPGAPVLLAGREIGKVTKMESPVPLSERPPGHLEDEVAIEVEVDGKAQIYRNVTVDLTQQSLMGQQVIDFVHGDPATGVAPDRAEFAGERVPDVSEAVSKQLQQLMGPGSDLAETLRNAHLLMDTLNHSQIKQTIQNAEQMTDTLKREPWRLLWPSTKKYGE